MYMSACACTFCTVAVQYLAGTAWAMHQFHIGLRAWAHTLHLYTYRFMAWTACAVYVEYMGVCACMYALFLYNVFGMGSLGDAPTGYSLPRAWARPLYLYPYIIWYGQPERRT